MRSKTEILRQLIELAYDDNPADIDITIRDCLDLYGELVRAESLPIPGVVCELHADAEGANTHTSAATPEPASVPPVKDPPDIGPGAGGRGGKEKQEIFRLLKAYRDAHGVDAFQEISRAANGAVTAEQVLSMIQGAKTPLAVWRIVGAAIDYLNK